MRDIDMRVTEISIFDIRGDGKKKITMDASQEAIDFSGKGLQAHDAQIVASMLPKCT